jgi:hypothetical protein
MVSHQARPGPWTGHGTPPAGSWYFVMRQILPRRKGTDLPGGSGRIHRGEGQGMRRGQAFRRRRPVLEDDSRPRPVHATPADARDPGGSRSGASPRDCVTVAPDTVPAHPGPPAAPGRRSPETSARRAPPAIPFGKDAGPAGRTWTSQEAGGPPGREGGEHHHHGRVCRRGPRTPPGSWTWPPAPRPQPSRAAKAAWAARPLPVYARTHADARPDARHPRIYCLRVRRAASSQPVRRRDGHVAPEPRLPGSPHDPIDVPVTAHPYGMAVAKAAPLPPVAADPRALPASRYQRVRGPPAPPSTPSRSRTSPSATSDTARTDH